MCIDRESLTCQLCCRCLERKVEVTRACRQAVSQAVGYNVYDVNDILKGFLEQEGDLKKSITQRCVFFLPPLSNSEFKLLDKKLYPEKSGF